MPVVDSRLNMIGCRICFMFRPTNKQHRRSTQHHYKHNTARPIRDMLGTASFTNFSTLPAELRLLVWEEALRSPTAAILDCGETRGLSLRVVGTNIDLIGQSCKEARRQMQQMCCELMPRRRGLVLISNFHWFIPQHTMFCLTDFESTNAFLELFVLDQLLRVKYVALAWTRFDQLARMCMAVAKKCPALNKVFIVRCENESFQSTTCCALQKNAHLSFGVMNGPSLSNDMVIDTDYFGALLLEYFGTTPPTLHFMSN